MSRKVSDTKADAIRLARATHELAGSDMRLALAGQLKLKPETVSAIWNADATPAESTEA